MTYTEFYQRALNNGYIVKALLTYSNANLTKVYTKGYHLIATISEDQPLTAMWNTSNLPLGSIYSWINKFKLIKEYMKTPIQNRDWLHGAVSIHRNNFAKILSMKEE